MTGLSEHEAAAIEAEEEAGVTGTIGDTPIGSYRYRKYRRNGTSLMIDVNVFALAVDEVLPDWKEAAERERRWFAPAEAASAVNEPDLREILRSFAPKARR